MINILQYIELLQTTNKLPTNYQQTTNKNTMIVITFSFKNKEIAVRFRNEIVSHYDSKLKCRNVVLYKNDNKDLFDLLECYRYNIHDILGIENPVYYIRFV